MEHLTLKIESENPGDLSELQQYLYDNYPDLIVNEIYLHEPGVNKEPVVVSIIIALGGKKVLETIQNVIALFLDSKLEREKEANRHREEMLKLSIKSGTKNYSSVTKKKFMEIKLD